MTTHPMTGGAAASNDATVEATARQTLLSTMLREATAEHHVRAERHAVQQSLVRGQTNPQLYRAWLRSMRALHEVFEARLEQARRHPSLGAVIQDHHFRLALIDEDLDALAVILRQSDAEGTGHKRPEPHVLGSRTQAAWAAIDAMIEVDPTLVLGPFYVLEGSTNGGRFIAPAVRRSMPLPPDAGTRYLDPHGELTRERWATTKAALDALPLTPAQLGAIVVAAQRTFDAITTLMDELPQAS